MTMADLDQLIEEGLSKYGQGDLDGALMIWEQALSIDPENAQANSYVDYVRQHYELLTNESGVVAGSESASGPFGISADDPDYQIEILPGESIATSTAVAPPTFVDPVDEGWFIDHEAKPAAETVRPEGAKIPNGRTTSPHEIAAEFAEETPGFREAATGGFGSQITDVRKRDLGFVQPSNPGITPPVRSPTPPTATPVAIRPPAPPKPPPIPPEARNRRASVPPELKMTLRTPSDDMREPTPMVKPPPLVIRVPEKPVVAAKAGLATEPAKPPPLVFIEGEALAANIMANVEATIAAAQGSAPDLAPAIPYEILPKVPSAAVVAPPDLVISPFEAKPSLEDAPTTQNPPIIELGAAGTVAEEPAPVPVNPIELGAAGGPGEPGVPLAPGVASGRATTRDIASKPITRDVSAKSPTRELPADLKFPVDVSRQQDLVSAPTRELGLRPPDETNLTKHDIRPFREPAMPAPRAVDDGTRHDLILPFDPIDARSAQILDDVDDGAPASEAKEDRTRRRITALLDRAAEWNRISEPDKAVAAVDLALSEDPNSALAQKLIHRNRETIMTVFQTYLGDLSRQPILSRPLHELAKAPINPRAAFLLSRVDGSLSLDEILDVSGMPRLEAYRYLCHLLLRGILR